MVLLPLASHAQETPGRLDVLTPDGEAGTYRAGLPHFSAAPSPPEEGHGPLPLALVQSEHQPGYPNPDQGCFYYDNQDEVYGRIALVRDGGCSRADKFLAAAHGGASGIVIYGEDAADDSTLATNFIWGADVIVYLYGVTVTGYRGARLRAAVEAGEEVLVTMRTEPAVVAEAAPGQAPLSVAVWPNPARGAAMVSLALGRPDDVTVTVHDALGRRVAVLHEGPLPAGEHAFRFGSGTLAGGAYFVRASTAAAAVTRPLVLTR